jgi:large repetitive protein
MFIDCSGNGQYRGRTGQCECYAGFTGENCSIPVCGDEVVLGSEECDDSNYRAYDGCSGCQVECGWDCSEGECSGVCGDGMRKGAEECDDGNTASGDGCSRYCMVEVGYTCGGASSCWKCGGSGDTCLGRCGDGTRPEGSSKECDDGNNEDGDGCSGACQIECGWECVGGTVDSADTCTTLCGDKALSGE